ncbi:succinate dehydrogenase [Afifella sp. IM 167]|uniref:succinate dehydrogenase n=1 Tax=Afifella sp. IM 167 TaxID=2033586 RepID=UPI001CCF176C|nr:succinate dehydrogenase [Afifella sp. IM 167]MBZ8134282.1 succinate dehydrogenase [Afifella sp. IM 167]
MSERGLFLAQRLSALLLGPLVLVHLAVILYAVRNGLTAGEILARTHGSAGWGLFYGLFVLAASVHAPIGVRNVLAEWTPLSKGTVDALAALFGAFLLVLGARAVFAVVMA